MEVKLCNKKDQDAKKQETYLESLKEAASGSNKLQNYQAVVESICQPNDQKN